MALHDIVQPDLLATPLLTGLQIPLAEIFA